MSFAQIIYATLGASILIAILIGNQAQRLGDSWALMDYPDGDRKLHRGPVPLVGGFPVMAAVILSSVALMAYFWQSEIEFSRSLCWFLVSVLGFFSIGLMDDRHNLSAKRRLISFFLFLIFILSVEESFIVHQLVFSGGLVVHLGNFSILFTLICIAGLINAVNMADGKNGLVIGLAVIWLLFLAVHANAYLLPIIFAMMGALLVAFCYNMKNRFFLGDAGSYAISTAIALLTIYIYNDNPRALPADQVALLFALPILDAIRLIVQRLLNGVSPFSADRNHLHHYLWFMLGWPMGLIVYFLTASAFIILGELFHSKIMGLAFAACMIYIATIAAFSRAIRHKDGNKSSS